MMHSFDSAIAEKYGILEAVLLNHIYYWIEKNRANEQNFYDGNYWTYNSTRAFNELFPYVTERQIKNALRHLREEEIIITGNYNENAYNRTLWYALSEKGLSIVQKRPMEETKVSNGKGDNVRPIPDIKPDNKPNKEPDNNTVSNDTVRSTDVQRVTEAWNSLPSVKHISRLVPDSQRHDWLKVRIRDYGIDDVLKAIDNIRYSPFLLGQGKGGWTVTFDWFVRPNNFPKVLDGNYLENKPDEPQPTDDGGEVWQ